MLCQLHLRRKENNNELYPRKIIKKKEKKKRKKRERSAQDPTRTECSGFRWEWFRVNYVRFVFCSGLNPTRHDLENALHYFCGSSGPFLLGLQSNNLIQDPLPCTHFWILCTLFKALFLFPFLGYNSQLWIPDYSFMVLFVCPLCLLEAHAYLVWVGVYFQILGVNKNSISHPVELSTYKQGYIGFKWGLLLTKFLSCADHNWTH